MSLNPQQYQAITYTNGPLLVLAGAGSGKTRVITEKIAYLIREKGYLASQIVAITFTNKASQEMSERITNLLSSKTIKGLTVNTFHALGMQILRQEATYLNLKPHFSVFDASDSWKVLRELSPSSDNTAIARLQQTISLWKNALLSPAQVLALVKDDWEKQACDIYLQYQDTLNAYHAVDFDDLIYLPCCLFRDNIDVRVKWQNRIRYLLVDECQDTNPCQYTLMQYLTGEKAQFTAVGDDDQSIYAWRGADIENLRKLQQDYPNLKVIKLEQNYRSTARILRVANAVIAHNDKLFNKKLWSNYGDGEMVTVLTCRDQEHEADAVAQRINRHREQNHTYYSDYAILYRGKHQAKLFENALRSAKIPYRVSGGQSFFERSEIKDILAYMRVLANPNDDPAFLRAVTTPKGGVGEEALKRLNIIAQEYHESLFTVAIRSGVMSALPTQSARALEAWLNMIHSYRSKASTENAGSLLQELVQEINYEQYLFQTEDEKPAQNKWRNVQDFISWINEQSKKTGKNIIEQTQTIALMTLLEDKNTDKPTDVVQLSTLHASKGLEYPHVFLVGCEEGLFPHENSLNEGRLDEERRLMYVGITRARHTLTLTHCEKRRKAGHWEFIEPSRFLDEMPSEDLRILGRKDGEPIVSHADGMAFLKNMIDKLSAQDN